MLFNLWCIKMKDIDKFKEDFLKDTEDFEKKGFIVVTVVMLVLTVIVLLSKI